MSSIFRTLLVGLFGFIFLLSLLSTCSRSRSGGYNTVETRTVMPSASLVTAADQFDLRVLEELVKKSQDAEGLERRLNQESPRYHNLDLDENGVVDFIKVDEYGSGSSRGLSLTIDVPDASGNVETQEIATIEIERETDRANYYVHGNSSIYGHNHYYRSHFGLGDALLLGWIFSNHRPYASPWGYNRHPDYYSNPRPMAPERYRQDVRQRTAGSTLTAASSRPSSSSLRSPNAGKNASTVRAPLTNPTASQRSFQARNPSKQVRSGGFGRSSSSSTAPRSSTTTRTRSFSGGGK